MPPARHRSRPDSGSLRTTTTRPCRLMASGLDEHDVLITSGGVSVGEFDFVKDVQEALGVERRLWQVAMKPGKPLVFGVRGEKLVFGVPGQPGCVDGLVRALHPPGPAAAHGTPAGAAAAATGRAAGGRGQPAWSRPRGAGAGVAGGGRWVASSTGPQGSGILRSMVLANGLVFVPAESGGLRAGDEVDLMLLREDLVSEEAWVTQIVAPRSASGTMTSL